MKTHRSIFFTVFERILAMSVRAKFKCVGVDAGYNESKSIQLEAVIDGSEENKQFFSQTPSGRITIGCVNPAANKQFEVGKEYYVDFTPVST